MTSGHRPTALEVMKTEITAALRLATGSDCEDFSDILVSQVTNALWLKQSDSEERERQINAAITAMQGMKPRDELEGMLIIQLIASNNAAMECYRRAMLAEQTFEARRENLNQANKLSRTYAMLTDALGSRRRDHRPGEPPFEPHRQPVRRGPSRGGP